MQACFHTLPRVSLHDCNPSFSHIKGGMSTVKKSCYLAQSMTHYGFIVELEIHPGFAPGVKISKIQFHQQEVHIIVVRLTCHMSRSELPPWRR